MRFTRWPVKQVIFMPFAATGIISFGAYWTGHIVSLRGERPEYVGAAAASAAVVLAGTYLTGKALDVLARLAENEKPAPLAQEQSQYQQDDPPAGWRRLPQDLSAFEATLTNADTRRAVLPRDLVTPPIPMIVRVAQAQALAWYVITDRTPMTFEELTGGGKPFARREWAQFSAWLFRYGLVDPRNGNKRGGVELTPSGLEWLTNIKTVYGPPPPNVRGGPY